LDNEFFGLIEGVENKKTIARIKTELRRREIEESNNKES
jgi:hypothetical protein